MKLLSKDDAYAVALLLNRLDLVNYEHPLTALDQLSPEYQETVRELHRGGACLPLGGVEHHDSSCHGKMAQQNGVPVSSRQPTSRRSSESFPRPIHQYLIAPPGDQLNR